MRGFPDHAPFLQVLTILSCAAVCGDESRPWGINRRSSPILAMTSS